MSTATCPCIASLRQICMDTPKTTCDRFPGSVYSVLCYRCVYEKRALPWQAAFALCALQDRRLLWRFPVFRLPCTPAWTNASRELGHRTNLARGSASAARRHEAVGSFPGRRSDGARFDLIGALLSQYRPTVAVPLFGCLCLHARHVNRLRSGPGCPGEEPQSGPGKSEAKTFQAKGHEDESPCGSRIHMEPQSHCALPAFGCSCVVPLCPSAYAIACTMASIRQHHF